jgi:hypothetical protein
MISGVFDFPKGTRISVTELLFPQKITERRGGERKESSKTRLQGIGDLLPGLGSMGHTFGTTR